MRTSLIAVGLGLAASGVLLAGCSKDHAVDHAKLGGLVKTTLEKQVGQQAKGVQCPDNLKAKVGATARCTLETMDGTKFGVTVTANSVQDNDVKFTAEVDKTPMQ